MYIVWSYMLFQGHLGALNHHHLFPGVIQSHYQKTPIVVQTCKEFCIKYNYVDTPLEAFTCHTLNILKDWDND